MRGRTNLESGGGFASKDGSALLDAWRRVRRISQFVTAFSKISKNAKAAGTNVLASIRIYCCMFAALRSAEMYP
jgi:hypothetical protein